MRTLFLGLPRANAIRQLRERNTRLTLTGDMLYNLVKSITRNTTTAELVRARFWQQELRSGNKIGGIEE